MVNGKFVSYLRVSTRKQGVSGLGIEAQRETIKCELNGGAWTIVGEFAEVETGTGKKQRPQLEAALSLCRVMGATLIVAKVDRLTRNPDFMQKLVEAKVDCWFCDLPNTTGPVGKFMLRSLLSVAELEAGLTADRTRKALAQAKKNGTKLGGFRGYVPSTADMKASLAVRQARAEARGRDLKPVMEALRAEGLTSLGGLARALTQRQIPTARGGTEWTAMQVKRVLERISA
jgi:DNA invertase Pin-like site-specific DNA recombinase